MAIISGAGIKIQLIASVTFPFGIDITQLADDTDPFSFVDMTIGEGAIGVNGDPVFWSRAALVPFQLSIVPNSDNDKDLQVIFDSNRVGQGKLSVDDEIFITGIYPSGEKISLLNGKMFTGSAAQSVQSTGRMKSKTYTFAFGNYTRV